MCRAIVTCVMQVGVLASVVGDCTVGISLAQEAATALAEISSSSKKGAAAVEAAMVQAMQAADATGDEHTQTKVLLLFLSLPLLVVTIPTE